MTEKTFGAAAENKYLVPASIVVAAIILAGAWIYTVGVKAGAQQKADIASGEEQSPVSELEEKVLPSEGVELPVVWGELGAKLVDAGVIDADKFKAIYEQRGAFTKANEDLLLGKNNGWLVMNSDNAGYLLNLLWALGLGSKNSVLDTGEMMNPAYGGAGNFASTGGWTIAEGDAMDHYSRHEFFALTTSQQALVEKVSKGIYRPCCGNSTHFPDCNHGMAMLGLLELMASQGVSEGDMWKTALAVNSYWFPNNYLTIAAYMEGNGVDWKDVSPREMLGAKYSSSRGYADIASQVAEPQQRSVGGSGCGIDAGSQPAAPQRQQQQPGCGI
ncbi:MAG: hypothetical protein Q7R85_03600 [bacterium]|nr:hypothetical protein [bacterium]